jgi:hypothetical protein
MKENLKIILSLMRTRTLNLQRWAFRNITYLARIKKQSWRKEYNRQGWTQWEWMTGQERVWHGSPSWLQSQFRIHFLIKDIDRLYMFPEHREVASKIFSLAGRKPTALLNAQRILRPSQSPPACLSLKVSHQIRQFSPWCFQPVLLQHISCSYCCWNTHCEPWS